MSSAPIDNILSRLEKVRQRQPGQYSARCPAHADKGPSLSVRETPEGAVLLHCFAGCSVTEVAAAMGLEMTALFPPSERRGNEPRRLAKAIAPSQALEILRDEAMVIAVIASDMHHGKQIREADYARLRQAVGQVNYVRSVAMGEQV